MFLDLEYFMELGIMSKKLLVFISSPYTLGDQGENVRIQMDMFDRLNRMGFVPFAPLLYHFQHMVHPLDYDDWLDIDFAMLERCDVVLRLPGESGGADKEVAHAKIEGIPVVYSFYDLVEYELSFVVNKSIT